MTNPRDVKTEDFESNETTNVKNDLVKALKNSDEHFRVFMDLLPICFMAFRGGIIIYVNPGLLKLLGYQKTEDLIGNPADFFFTPESQQTIKKRIKRIAEEGSLSNPPIELLAVKKNGENVPVEAESIVTIHQGTPSVMVIIRDITLRKAEQEALKKSEENLKTILHEMPEGILVVDGDKVLLINRTLARLLGYESETELIGRSKFDFIHPDYHSVIRERVDRIMGRGTTNPLLKMKMLRKNGEIVAVESSSISIRFDGKQAVMGVLRDITLQNQLERTAALNEKLVSVGTFAAGIAHEINNPLTYVLANLIFLKDNFLEFKGQLEKNLGVDERGRRLFKEIEEELADTTEGGERIRDIVRGLKSFVHTAEDRVTEFDLNETVESAIIMTFHLLKLKAVVERNLTPRLPLLTANPGRLHQVFTNLLINAAQSIEGQDPKENTIRVRTGQKGRNLFVEISDTGKGIPENILPRIFDPFFTTKPIGVGTGLGLSICREIVRQYQGTLEVQSSGGRGTTFTVHLPLENGLKAAAPELPPPALNARGRILVADDEPGNLEILNRILKKNNDVLSAISGLDALGILEREKGRVDAIVSDFNMPDLDGEGLYKTLAQKFPGLEKRMIFVTGGLFTAEARSFLASIPNPCLEKPFNFEELLRIISQWTEISPKPESKA